MKIASCKKGGLGLAKNLSHSILLSPALRSHIFSSKKQKAKSPAKSNIIPTTKPCLIPRTPPWPMPEPPSSLSHARQMHLNCKFTVVTAGIVVGGRDDWHDVSMSRTMLRDVRFVQHVLFCIVFGDCFWQWRNWLMHWDECVRWGVIAAVAILSRLDWMCVGGFGFVLSFATVYGNNGD